MRTRIVPITQVMYMWDKLKALWKIIQPVVEVVTTLAPSLANIWSTAKTNATNWLSNLHNNEFNAQEAEKNRTWQEQMWNLHESPSAQMQQRLQSGLNVMDGVNSQSVGSGSAASASSHHSAIPQDFTSFSQLPLMFQQLKQSKLETKNKELTNTNIEEQNISLKLENQMKALEAGNKEEYIRIQMEILRQDERFKKASADKLEAEAQLAWDRAINYRNAKDSGVNEFIDAHNKAFAEIKKIESDIAYHEALTNTENELREGKVTAQTTANLAAAFEYKLRQKYGEDLANIEYEQAKRVFENDKELNEVYKTMERNRSKILENQADIQRITATDLETLPPWMRYILNLFEKVVEAGADLVL